jgi:ABC-type transport system involved in multi-copper enzyme maturation permease subunit
MSGAGFAPVLLKELRAALRGSRAALLITVYVGLALLAMRLVYGAVADQTGAGAPIFNAQVGQALFIGLALTVQGLTMFLAPATTVNSVSAEYERRTFELLAATPITPAQLLLGKLLTGLAFVLLLLLAVTPLFSVVLLFGGVTVVDIARVLAVILGTAVAGAVLGLFCSALTRQTYMATLLCYTLLVGLVGGTLLAANFWSLTHANQPPPPRYVAANPLSAVGSALGRTRPPEVISPSSLRPVVALSLLTQGVNVDVQGERVTLPLYRASLTIFGAASLLLFWASLHLVRVRGRWRLGPADGVMLALCLIYALAAWLARGWWGAGLAG